MTLLSLGDPSQDQDGASAASMKRKQRRKKKVIEKKWTQLWFVPTHVLEEREEDPSGQKRGKRVGFDRFNSLSCKRCGLGFHKSESLDLHNMERHEGAGRSLAAARQSQQSQRRVQQPRRSSRAMAAVDYTDTEGEVEILDGEPEILEVTLDDSEDENVEDNRIKPVQVKMKKTSLYYQQFNQQPRFN